MNRGGFSWKTFFGVTARRQRIARRFGMPMTKSGRQRKAGGGSFLAMLFTILFDR